MTFRQRDTDLMVPSHHAPRYLALTSVPGDSTTSSGFKRQRERERERERERDDDDDDGDGDG